MIPAWLFSPTGILGVLLAAASLYGVVITKMYGSVNHEYSDFKAAVEQAKKQAESDARNLKAEQDRLMLEYGQRWADSYAYRVDHPVVRVLRTGCDLPQGTTVPGFTGKLTDASSEQGLRADVVIESSECEKRLNWAAEDAAKLILIQEWVEQQREASK